jgi:hypothetical protein
VLDRGAQAVTRATARCASQVLDRGAQANARGGARFASQERGARAVARGGVALVAVRKGRQRRDAAAAGEEQLGRCAVGRLYTLRRFAWPIASRRAHHRRRMFEP